MANVEPLNEDDVYRTSSQYRLWSFTTDSLAELRATTNTQAAIRVRDAIRRVGNNDEASAESVDCLTVEEEQTLVGFYCEQAMKLAEFCEFPTNIKATAVQYLKRFYLSNSPMTYHPKQMMPCALFFATKTDNHYIALKSFAGKLPKTTQESVIAPEGLLTQGLRFTFDVRHPHRGLEGGFMELQAMALGKYQGPGSSPSKSKVIQGKMINLELAPNDKAFEKSTEGVQKRMQNAHNRASALLKTVAILGDAYFLYTPSQIWLGSLMAADEVLATFYVQTILPESSEIEDQVLETLHACAALLTEKKSGRTEAQEKEEARRIDKKLYKCRNPEKTDITTMSHAEKRASEKDANGEKAAKRRKLEGAQKEIDDPFGPSLKK